MTEYEQDTNLQSLVDRMVASLPEFSAIRSQSVGVKALLKIKEDGAGEPVQSQARPVKLKKLDTLSKFVGHGETPVDYVLIMDNYTWVNVLGKTEREALVHGGLMQIFVQLDDDGNAKLKTRKPDINEFVETFSRYGAWNTQFLQLSSLLSAAQTAADQLREEV